MYGLCYTIVFTYINFTHARIYIIYKPNWTNMDRKKILLHYVHVVESMCLILSVHYISLSVPTKSFASLPDRLGALGPQWLKLNKRIPVSRKQSQYLNLQKLYFMLRKAWEFLVTCNGALKHDSFAKERFSH